MKKFVFTLQSVYDYRKTVEKKERSDLKRAQAILNELLAEEKRLEEAFEKNERSLERALEENIDVAGELARHDAFFRFLREARQELSVKIQRAQEEKDRRQALLIATMRTLKTYDKLKSEQYAEYLEEVRREEAKDMGDLVSYRTIASAERE